MNDQTQLLNALKDSVKYMHPFLLREVNTDDVEFFNTKLVALLEMIDKLEKEYYER